MTSFTSLVAVVLAAAPVADSLRTRSSLRGQLERPRFLHAIGDFLCPQSRGAFVAVTDIIECIGSLPSRESDPICRTKDLYQTPDEAVALPTECSSDHSKA
jgi:hypothetical protein